MYILIQKLSCFLRLILKLRVFATILFIEMECKIGATRYDLKRLNLVLHVGTNFSGMFGESRSMFNYRRSHIIFFKRQVLSG